MTVADADAITNGSRRTTTTIRIVDYAGAEDWLALPTVSGISNDGYVNGVLTLSSTTATPEQWQAALRSVRYQNTSEVPSGISRAIEFRMNDGLGDSAPVSRTVEVVGVDDTPILWASGAYSGYREGGAARAISPELYLADSDSTRLTGATVRLTNYVASEDVLGFTPGTATGDIQATLSGALVTLASAGGAASLDQWRAALQAVTYRNTSRNPDTTARIFEFQASDGSSSSPVRTDALPISAIDDTPTLVLTPGTTAFREGANVASEPVAVDAGLVLQDPDSPTMSSAAVQIWQGAATGDTLAFTANAGTGDISGSASGTYISLTSASGTATVAQWEAALRAVTFANASENPAAGDRSIRFLVHDGSTATTVFKTVSVTPVNDPPVLTASSGSASFVEGANTASTPVVVDPGISLSDADIASGQSWSATVRIADYVAGEDRLLFSPDLASMGAIQYANEGQVLRLWGPTSLSEWQAVLRSVRYGNDSDTPSAASRSIEFQISDGVDVSSTVRRTVSLTPTDDAVQVWTSMVFYEEGDALVQALGAVGIYEPDSALSSATITITDYRAGEDVLGFTADPATMGNIDAGIVGGVITLRSADSSATTAQWEAALRAVTYANTAATPTGPSRTLQVRVDGVLTSAETTQMISVQGVDSPTVLRTTEGYGTFTEGSDTPSLPVFVDPGLTVSDPDGPLRYAEVTLRPPLSGRELGWTADPAQMGNIRFESYTVRSDGYAVLRLASEGGTASDLQWQSALRAVTFVDHNDADLYYVADISFRLFSGNPDYGAWGNKSIWVFQSNDSPTAVVARPSETLYTPATPVEIRPGLDLNDPDGGTLAVATVRIVDYDATQDRLIFATTAASGSDFRGELSQDGTLYIYANHGTSPTFDQWEAVLDAVRYDNVVYATGESPDQLTRTIEFVVGDPYVRTTPIQKTITFGETGKPVVSPNHAWNTYFENQSVGGVALFGGLQIADADSGTFAWATVQVRDHNAAEDRLWFTNPMDGSMGNIQGTVDAQGVLRLSSEGGVATKAEWLAALRSVRYENLNEAMTSGSRTLEYQISDGTHVSPVGLGVIQLHGQNDAPQLDLDATTAGSDHVAFPEGNEVAVVGPNVRITDVDSAQLSGATLTLLGALAGDALLAGTLPAGITATLSGNVMTLTGVASLQEYEQALQSVRFSTSSEDIGLTPRTIEISVRDDSGTSISGSPVARTTVTARVQEGTTGDDTLAGSAGSDRLNGGAGDDTLRGGAAQDMLDGGVGNDHLVGGGAGDTLAGGSGMDTFAWSLAEPGTVGTAGAPVRDRILDFTAGAGGDVLDVRDLLQGEAGGPGDLGNLLDYLHVEGLPGGDTVLHVSSTGGFAGGFAEGQSDLRIELQGVDADTLGADSAAVLQRMLDQGNLRTD